MGYIRAEEVLPKEIIEKIQQYVDGKNLYIPRKAGMRLEWGSNTCIRQETRERNESIRREHRTGAAVAELAQRYFLSEKSIQRILREQ